MSEPTANPSHGLKLDFTTFILSISSAAFMGLGLSRETEVISAGQSSGVLVDLEMAKQNIDLLELMSEKTRGNLTADEDKLLQQVLFETRMHFVEALRKVKQGERK